MLKYLILETRFMVEIVSEITSIFLIGQSLPSLTRAPSVNSTVLC